MRGAVTPPTHVPTRHMGGWCYFFYRFLSLASHGHSVDTTVGGYYSQRGRDAKYKNIRPSRETKTGHPSSSAVTMSSPPSHSVQDARVQQNPEGLNTQDPYRCTLINCYTYESPINNWCLQLV